MTYQGARSAVAQSELRRVFVVSKVRLAAADNVTDVLWVEVDAGSNLDVGEPVVAPVADVVDAIHDGARVTAAFPAGLGLLPEHAFEVVKHGDGRETIGLTRSSAPHASAHAGLRDMATLDG